MRILRVAQQSLLYQTGNQGFDVIRCVGRFDPEALRNDGREGLSPVTLQDARPDQGSDVVDTVDQPQPSAEENHSSIVDSGNYTGRNAGTLGFSTVPSSYPRP
jgi:hypothetical protein